MIGNKTNLSKFKNTEIIPSMFSEPNGCRKEINNRRKTGKFTGKSKSNNTLSNNQWVKEQMEIK